MRLTSGKFIAWGGTEGSVIAQGNRVTFQFYRVYYFNFERLENLKHTYYELLNLKLDVWKWLLQLSLLWSKIDWVKWTLYQIKCMVSFSVYITTDKRNNFKLILIILVTLFLFFSCCCYFWISVTFNVVGVEIFVFSSNVTFNQV